MDGNSEPVHVTTRKPGLHEAPKEELVVLVDDEAELL